jgi:multifunctional methyltransferase subunit TRM112
MRILTHNYLKSNIKGAEEGYPLSIEATTIEEETTEVSADFIINLLPKLEWSAILKAAGEISSLCEPPLPELPSVCPASEELLADSALCDSIHRVLMDIHITEGNLICPSTGRKYGVVDGIPNMVLHEDEVP